jgi:hypothetical protein
LTVRQLAMDRPCVCPMWQLWGRSCCAPVGGLVGSLIPPMASVCAHMLECHAHCCGLGTQAARGVAAISMQRTAATAEAAKKFPPISYEAQILSCSRETGDLRVCVLRVVVNAHFVQLRSFTTVKRPPECLAYGGQFASVVCAAFRTQEEGIPHLGDHSAVEVVQTCFLVCRHNNEAPACCCTDLAGLRARTV